MFRLYFLLILFLINTPIFSSTHHPQTFLKEVEGKANEGQLIVEHFCSSCHAAHPQIPLGAPKPGNKADWNFRTQHGFKSLLEHTEEGYHAMPARGGCFECSDRQLILAIAELLPQKDRKNFLLAARGY